jgi:hypothetical protein
MSRIPRRELIQALTEVQALVGEAEGLLRNDRDPLAREQGLKLLERATVLCVESTATDAPPKPVEMARFRTRRFRIREHA